MFPHPSSLSLLVGIPVIMDKRGQRLLRCIKFNYSDWWSSSKGWQSITVLYYPSQMSVDKGFLFSQLHEPLVLVRDSKILVTWQYFCGSAVCKTLTTWCHFGSEQPKWHHVISVLQTIRLQHRYHVTRIFEPLTKTNGPWSRSKRSACPRTSETDSINCCGCPVLRKTDPVSTKQAIKEK